MKKVEFLNFIHVVRQRYGNGRCAQCANVGRE